jgi:hypothetical protein
MRSYQNFNKFSDTFYAIKTKVQTGFMRGEDNGKEIEH